MKLITSSLILVIGIVSLVDCAGLGVHYQWKYLDWVWPNVPLTKKNYIPLNPITQDVDKDTSGRVFVTTPQWLEGTPITLSLISNLDGPGGPLLTPYPHWSWHTPNDCSKLVSVYRIAIDECNRLWVVDTGTIAGKVVCPTKIMIFDLFTDRLMHQYIVPSDQTLYGESSLVTPIVEIVDKCENTYLYIADVSGHGLVIYNLQQDRSFRINNTRGNAFGPNIEAENMTIAGETFDLTDGTLGMSLSPPGFFKNRYLYFNSLASFYQKFSSVDSLKFGEFQEPIVFESIVKRQSQAGVQAMSKKGVLFFQLAELTSIACWNIDRPFTWDNIEILAFDEITLQYVSGIKVIKNHAGDEELWFNTNRLQKTINKNRKINEINFRIIKGHVDDIIRGTKCEPICEKSQYPDTSSWRQV
ncbi:hypothetical protein HCN44_006501 [Aphidius gifuensis]|uniref:Bee-milk protein n=1 Tax=Aphidius gifuensis TaxID=684658 RepID=A0A834Y1J6_APHGI|nr:major royal jelly protein 2-like [Aphidius gifuensis]KAF7995394.1 hypothetical protein HCN44_006501 [Aphidius gifuensis]